MVESEHLKRAGGVFIYSAAAIFGIIAANYVGTVMTGSAVAGPWTLSLAGLALFAIPVFGIRGNAGWEGPTRIFLGVAGLTMLLRGILSIVGLNTAGAMPQEVLAVV
jgi:hypothetical protein